MEYLQYVPFQNEIRSGYEVVLNLIINGIPSILMNVLITWMKSQVMVLNLIINGIPSILYGLNKGIEIEIPSFKPYYKWNTFNTKTLDLCHKLRSKH